MVDEMEKKGQRPGDRPDLSSEQRLAGDDPITPAWQGRRDRVVWSVAGFDPSSGAGVTADLMTFAAFGLFGCSAITALTVQNTSGVYGWEAVGVDLLQTTLASLDEDLPALGIKIGMLGTPELAGVVAQFLSSKRLQNEKYAPVVVLDPVLRSSSGRPLFPDEGLEVFRELLLPAVDWITPNWAELAVLSGEPVESVPRAEQAARVLQSRWPKLGVVATGGDQDQPVDLVLSPTGETVILPGSRVETTSTHGTGCAFSSALLAELVNGAAAAEAARAAKAFVEGALRAAPGLGKGRGPTDLLWPLRRAAPHGAA